MAKLDQLSALYGANVAESSGVAPSPGVPRVAAGPAPKPARLIGVERPRDAALIDLDRIVPDPDQPRKEFTEGQMAEMTESLRERGQLQPIRVRWDDGLGKYRLIMGERRYRAAVLAGLKSLAAVIHEAPLSPGETLEIQVIENTARENLRPIDLANAIRRLMDEFGYTQADVAARLKMSQAGVSQSLSLLNLDPEIRAKVDEGTISTRAAQHIARVASPETQRELAARVEHGGLTEAETARVVREKRHGSRLTGKGAKAKLPTERTVKTAGGLRVTVVGRKGLDGPAIRDALRQALDLVEAELDSDQAAA